ncbi:hypothetical protein [Streptomyces sp. NPDC058751]|uniref:hypothetical protein n=1 Tax=Streptomyces sp. NPDC058751 TaxID=3346623 RepID=UPI0036BAE44A
MHWTQQRPHLAGAVGAALFRHALDSSWPVHRSTTRVVTVTGAGRTALRARLGLPDDALFPETNEAGGTAPRSERA